MKLYFLKFGLWLYTEHIQEDWDDYNKLGKIVIYPFWFIRATLIWLTFPLWIPIYNFQHSKVYLQYQKVGQAMSMEQQMEMLRTMKANKNIERNNFLIQKEKKGKFGKKF